MKQRFSFPLLKAERGSSFSSYLIRSAAPRHCLFLPGATRRPPPASAYFAQQIFEGNTCPNLSSNPPVASNVTLDSFITLSASTEWNCIQNPTREEKIKSTEQAFLKQGSQWKKKTKQSYCRFTAAIQLFTTPMHLYPIIQKDLANVQKEWYGCLFLWEETNWIKLISFSDRHLWFFTGFANETSSKMLGVTI